MFSLFVSFLRIQPIPWEVSLWVWPACVKMKGVCVGKTQTPFIFFDYMNACQKVYPMRKNT